MSQALTIMDNADESTPDLAQIVDAIVTAETGQQALDAVRRLGSPGLAPETRARFVNELICDPRSRIRFWGMMVAGRFGNESTIPILEKRLEENRLAFDENVRHWDAIQSWKFAFLRLVELTGTSAVPRVMELISSKDPFWQKQGLIAADRLLPDDRVAILREVECHHENPDIREAATLRLARLSN